MSWNARSEGPIDRDQIADIVLTPQPSPDGVGPFSFDQQAAAVEAAALLARACGRPGDQVYVSLSGHANLDHAPAAGWADELITVTVSAAPPKG